MIECMELGAFKSFPKATIKFKKLTVLAGLNNSGKSSAVQALRMYLQASHGDAPLLDMHGSLAEIRSNYASADEDVSIKLNFSHGASDELNFSRGSIRTPSVAPLFEYIGADRLGPQTVLPVNPTRDSPPRLGSRGEYVLDFLEKLGDTLIPEALRHASAHGNTLEYTLSGWLNEIAPGVELKFSNSRRQEFGEVNFDNFRPANVGFGLSYTLPILVGALGLASMPPAHGWSSEALELWHSRRKAGTLLLVENPEAHLHPKGQTAMGLFLAYASWCGVQVVVETHSDHLLDGIRLAVKHNPDRHADVQINFFSKMAGEPSDLVCPDIDRQGKLNYWPEDFFDQFMRNRAELARRS